MNKIILTFLLIIIGFSANAGKFDNNDWIANPIFGPTIEYITIRCDDGSEIIVPILEGQDYDIDEFEEAFCPIIFPVPPI